MVVVGNPIRTSHIPSQLRDFTSRRRRRDGRGEESFGVGRN